MGFDQPARLWLLVFVAALAVVYVAVQGRRGRYAVRFTNLALLDTIAPRRPAWRRHVPAALFLATILAVVAALAEPYVTTRRPVRVAEVVMAVDVSPSMQARDVAPSRLQAAQDALESFVTRLPPHVEAGLVVFAGTANVAVPPTTEHERIIAAVRRLDFRSETALGEAVLVSLGALDGARSDGAPAPGQILLLSDGASTAGRPVPAAVEAASASAVPVSTIAFGTPSGTVELAGGQTPVPPDEATLRRIAADTGGRFYTAETAGELHDVYNDLITSITLVTRRAPVTDVLLLIAVAGAMATALASLLWFSRLP